METTTERLEEIALLSLLAEEIPVQPDAPENLLKALRLGLLQLESAEVERKHLDASIKAARRVMTFAGAVA